MKNAPAPALSGPIEIRVHPDMILSKFEYRPAGDRWKWYVRATGRPAFKGQVNSYTLTMLVEVCIKNGLGPTKIVDRLVRQLEKAIKAAHASGPTIEPANALTNADEAA